MIIGKYKQSLIIENGFGEIALAIKHPIRKEEYYGIPLVGKAKNLLEEVYQELKKHIFDKFNIKL